MTCFNYERRKSMVAHLSEDQRKAFFENAGIRQRNTNYLLGVINGICLDGSVNSIEVERTLALMLAMEDSGLALRQAELDRICELFWSLAEEGNVEADHAAQLAALREDYERVGMYRADTTLDGQHFLGMLTGILADGVIETEEARALLQWLDDKPELNGLWPFEEVRAITTDALRNGRIDVDEHEKLVEVYSAYAARSQKALTFAYCAVNPDVVFAGRRFLFTGTSNRGVNRSALEAEVESLGGIIKQGSPAGCDYLVVGGNGSGRWQYEVGGGKVVKAMSLRAKGDSIMIIHENDFWDAVEDAKITSSRND